MAQDARASLSGEQFSQSVAPAAESLLEENWPSWRGAQGKGVSLSGQPPLEWSEGKNVRWKVPLQGRGHSTPVIWEGRLYLTTAVEVGEPQPVVHKDAEGSHHNVAPRRRVECQVLALDVETGQVLWQRTVATVLPHDSTHVSGSWASASPSVGPRGVVASFGSMGLHALSHDGELMWSRDLGNMSIKHGHGEGSSPVLFGHHLVVNWDHEAGSFVVALDVSDGKELWRTPRQEGTSWSSPLIVEVDGKVQVIVAASNRVRAYDLKTGAVVWECGGLSGNVVASPVAGDGVVYVANSYDSREMLAIRLAGSRGDLTGTEAVLWTRHRDTPYVPSPVLYRDALCFLRHYQGILTCVLASTGDVLAGPTRLAGVGNVYASLVAANGRLYVLGREGRTAVVSADGSQVLAVNPLDDTFSASPIIHKRSLILRGEQYLYRVEEPQRTLEVAPEPASKADGPLAQVSSASRIPEALQSTPNRQW